MNSQFFFLSLSLSTMKQQGILAQLPMEVLEMIINKVILLDYRPYTMRRQALIKFLKTWEWPPDISFSCRRQIRVKLTTIQGLAQSCKRLHEVINGIIYKRLELGVNMHSYEGNDLNLALFEKISVR